MKRRNQPLVIMATAVALATSIQTSQAVFTSTLAALSANPANSLTIGDKTFSNFSFVPSNLTAFDPAAIVVTATQVGSTYYLTWAGNISYASTGPGSADLLLNYRVTATAGVITEIDQRYTGSAQPAGSAFLSVDETASAGGITYGFSHLQVGDLSDPFAEPGDTLLIVPPQVYLDVTKDIAFGIASPTGGFVTISEVQQSFHQTAVPEASTMFAGALLLLPFGATFFRMLRKSKA